MNPDGNSGSVMAKGIELIETAVFIANPRVCLQISAIRVAFESSCRKLYRSSTRCQHGGQFAIFRQLKICRSVELLVSPS